MIIVDSSVWIDSLKGAVNAQTVWLERELGTQPIALTDLILCEVLQGIRPNHIFEGIREELSHYPLLRCSGQSLAIAAAQNYRHLRTRGITVRKTIDCLIATFCIAHGHTLLHRDRDFDPFEQHLGLQVLHPHPA
jgi:predicted nucleic acid-binding protein